MAVKWSNEQIQAIESIGHNELLNAGAGSGKTAVLSEHVIFLLEHGYKLDQLLIMTFTNAAANEMKQRIKKKIQAIPELNKLYSDAIESCHIETFDAFYLFLVKKYHYLLGLDKNINIFDNNVIDVLYKRMIDEVLDEQYQKNDELFNRLISEFCVKDDRNIIEIIEYLISKSHLTLDKYSFFDHYLDPFFKDEFIQSLIDSRYQTMLEKLAYLKEKADLLEDETDKASILNFLNSFDECKGYDELFYKTSHSQFPRKVGARSTPDATFRGNIRKLFNETFIGDASNFGNSETIFKLHKSMQPYAHVCIEIAKDVEKRMDAFKHKHNAFLFSDISMMAIQLIDIPEVLKEIKDSFRYILVDEYQDTNDVQEAVLNKISDNNVFMVGDVKQSIYRFRNANCMIFQNKYEKYKKGIDGHAIDMTVNFRSRHGLIDGFNDIFGQLMNKKTNLIDYEQGHLTKAGFSDYKRAKNEEIIDNFRYLTYDLDTIKQVYKPEEYEARLVAEEIISKINNKYPVYDSISESGLRPCTFKDFAIILDRSKQFPVFERIFAEYGIPLFVYNDEDVRKNVIFMIGPNILRVYNGVKNNNYDQIFVHAYVSISRSFLLNKSDEEIFNNVKANKFDSDPDIQVFKDVFKEMDGQPIYLIFTRLIEKLNIYSKIAKIGNFNRVSVDIESFIDLLKHLDEIRFNLEECINYFDDLERYDSPIKANPIKESDNSVTILNVHKSKGLEFPICYFPCLFNDFNRENAYSKIAVNMKYGIILPVVGENNESLLARKIFRDYEIQQDFEEKLRILYVAFTRAKEHACIVMNNCVEPDFNQIVNSKSFLEIVSYIKHFKDDIEIKNNLDNLTLNYGEISEKEQNDFILHEPLKINCKEIIKMRASKSANNDISEDALDFGNKMHLLLELADIEHKDLSYIKDDREKAYIEKVINLDIFKGVTNENIRHEFPFYDDSKKLLGIIDCMLIKDNEIDIIDFKLKNIDDDAYKKQLKTYYDYICNITSKHVKTYLISIIEGTCREVEMDE